MAKTEAQLPEITPNDAKSLAEAIRKIDKAVKTLVESGLNRKALVVLLHEETGVARRDINGVLDGLENLGAAFLDMSKEEKDPKK